MGIVTNVKWTCPNCETEQTAQLFDDHYPHDEGCWGEPIPRKAVPSNACLKSNDPCEKCGKYRLVNPPVTLVEFPIAAVEQNEQF